MISLKNYSDRFNKLPFWQKIIVVVVGMYVLKQLIELFKITSTLRSIGDFKYLLTGSGFTESFHGESKSSRTLSCTMYYAPWCGYCKTAKPEWEKLEQSINGKDMNGTKVLVTKIDCDDHPEIAEKEGIQKFPTFKFKMDGKHFDYNGGHNYNDWNKFIESIVHS